MFANIIYILCNEFLKNILYDPCGQSLGCYIQEMVDSSKLANEINIGSAPEGLDANFLIDIFNEQGNTALEKDFLVYLNNERKMHLLIANDP